MTFYSVLFHLILIFLSSSASMIQINHLCKTPRNGICIDIWKCPKYVTLLHRTSNPKPLSLLMDIRRNLCGFVNRDTPEVCCSKPVLTTTTTTTPPPFHYKGDLTEHTNFKLLPKYCGEIASGFRITRGTNTFPGEFPWMALIAYSFGDLPEFRCGGTVINERYVLTAAHCIDNSALLGVRLGEYNILTEQDCDDKTSANCEPAVQDFLINKVIIHPLYDHSTYVNDIALIRIATAANFTSTNVKPICLPFGEAARIDLTSKDAIVAGWGVTEKGDKSAVMLKTFVPVVPLEQCQKLYQDAQPITRNQICAGGYKGRDSCFGDSGGPLKFVATIERTARFAQYGIVSYGPKFCGAEGLPAIYTKVVEYTGWILDNLEP